MTEKRCYRCGPKPVTSFASNTSTADGLQPYCRGCHSTYTQAHYRANSEAYKARANAKRLHLKEVLRLSKLGKPCKDCGHVFEPCSMDYDHLDSNLKTTEVSLLVTCGSEARLLAEIAKCELVCSNCHRVRTRKRKYPHVA
jgi:hypothetical protein